MARSRRKWHPDCFDHVVMRGNNRQNIYRNPADFAAFFRALQYAHDKYPFTIVAYCIMSNHYHLLIRSPEVPLGKVMSHINRRYSDYFKWKYNHSGFLYESRYFAKMVTDPKGLLAASRYIHRNPIETKVPMVAKMEQYEYSSFANYKTNSPPPHPFIDLDLLPGLLPKSYHHSNEDYCTYCEQENEVDCEEKHLV